MILTVFRSRLREGNQSAYAEVAAQMDALARTMPGYIAHKGFVAEDGERLTLVEFADEESQRNWSANLYHAAAKKLGRSTFYYEYKLQVCSVLRESNFP